MVAKIELNGVTKRFVGREGASVVAVDDLSLSIATGELVCLIGTSGCGKTTTMKMINRLVEPTSGQISIDGTDIIERNPIELRRGIGYVVQRGGLFPHMTVADNVGLPCRLARWDASKVAARVDTLLDLVNLPAESVRDRFPRQLSGGQRQRVGVARALALNPPIMLMDEPFGALDPVTRTQLHQELTDLRARLDTTIVLVTHDLHEAFALGDRIALMDRGALVQIGTETDLRDRPANDFVRRYLRGHRLEARDATH